MTSFVIFGGSFDPPHLGHILAMTWAYFQGADRIIAVPSWDHPFGKKAAAPYTARVEMLNEICAALPFVEVSKVESEIESGKTYDVLCALEQQYPNAKFNILIGNDLNKDLSRWYRADELFSRAPAIRIGRLGYEGEAPITLPNISSTAVREALLREESPKEVAESTLTYIRKHGLYQ